MKKETRDTVKQAMVKIQEVINLLEKVKGDNEEVDTTADSLGFTIADLEYEVNG